jgi:DNA excision repair protein ERCC-1
VLIFRNDTKMDDDDYGADDDMLAALEAAESVSARQAQQRPAAKVQQPTPQRLDRAPPSGASASGPPKVVQPTPQALPSRSAGSSILVSPRQKGKPVLACLRSIPWEYSDILADYGLGLTTCALFLRSVPATLYFQPTYSTNLCLSSLKYHRLHPEYIYTRIRNLQGKYNLRILLTLVDIPNHEDALRELSKASLVNNATVILAWSAAEAARYLELYKSYEHAGFAAIRGQQASGYAERLVEFVTVPRTVNKADAVALVSSFGSLRHAVNASPEQIGVVGGWGEKKVRAWCRAVEEPFRVRKPGAKKAVREGGTAKGGAASVSRREEEDDDEADALIAAVEAKAALGNGRRNEPVPAPVPRSTTATPAVRKDDNLSDGVAAALARLREKG